MRFLAIVAILAGHWISWDSKYYLLRVAPFALSVLLFYVLSGYLISGILFDLKRSIEQKLITRRHAIKTFYIRRMLRIFPVYYIFIGLLVVLGFPNVTEYLPYLLTYTTNLYQAFAYVDMKQFNHFWSLAVEEQFYLFWPVLVLVTPSRKMLRLVTGGIIIGMISKVLCIIIEPGNWMLNAFFTPNLFFPLGLGALLALLERQDPALMKRICTPKAAMISLLLFAALFAFFDLYMDNLLYRAVMNEWLFSVVSFLFVGTAALTRFKGGFGLILSNRLSVFGGRISYSVYLLHNFVPHFYWTYIVPVMVVHPDRKPFTWAVYYIVCLALGALSFFLAERPFLSLKKHFPYLKRS